MTCALIAKHHPRNVRIVTPHDTAYESDLRRRKLVLKRHIAVFSCMDRNDVLTGFRRRRKFCCRINIALREARTATWQPLGTFFCRAGELAVHSTRRPQPIRCESESPRGAALLGDRFRSHFRPHFARL